MIYSERNIYFSGLDRCTHVLILTVDSLCKLKPTLLEPHDDVNVIRIAGNSLFSMVAKHSHEHTHKCC